MSVERPFKMFKVDSSPTGIPSVSIKVTWLLNAKPSMKAMQKPTKQTKATTILLVLAFSFNNFESLALSFF